MRVPPARRRRRDRPVELPGVHADGLDRLRARRRQRGGVQAERAHARRRASGWPPPSPRSSPSTRCSRSSPASARPAPRCAAPASTSSRSPARPATGKKVMAACAETLTPVLIEAGGKDALLVDEDADVDAAADAALWGACSNAGQTCIGVERVYVHERVYDEFLVAACSTRPATCAPTTPPTPRSGRSRCRASSTSSARTSTTRSTRGGRAVLGGPGAVGDRFVQPTVLVDVPEDSTRRAGGDLRPDGDGHQGAGTWTRRSRWPTAPATAWARRSSRRRAGWSSPSGSGRG